MLLKTWK